MTEDASDPAPQQEKAKHEADSHPAVADDAASSQDLDAILDAEGPQSVSGDGLTNDEAEALCAVGRCTVIVLAGGVGSGKTTLLTSMYEQFNQQSFGAYLFAGSETLFGFEKRAHGWRLPSGLRATGLSQPPWLYLVARQLPPAPRRRLLMADLSGEHFERIVTGERTPDSFPMLSRADQVAVVLDGSKLTDPKERLTERSRGEQLLQILATGDVVASPNVLCLVISKIDQYLADGREDDLDQIAERVQRNAGVTSALPVFRTAAEPVSTNFPMGHGVDALLAQWLAMPEYPEAKEQPHADEGGTAYSRFGSGNGDRD
jgi:hypothetical protein